MKLLLMELQFKLLFWLDKEMNKWRTYFFWMLLLYHWELKLQEVLWLYWSQEIQQFPQRNLRFSQPMLTINQVSWFKCMKVKDKWPRTVINLVNSHLMVLLQPQEVFLKLKLPLMLMKMVSWTFMLRIKLQRKLIKSLSQMIRVDYPRMTLKD